MVHDNSAFKFYGVFRQQTEGDESIRLTSFTQIWPLDCLPPKSQCTNCTVASNRRTDLVRGSVPVVCVCSAQPLTKLNSLLQNYYFPPVSLFSSHLCLWIFVWSLKLITPGKFASNCVTLTLFITMRPLKLSLHSNTQLHLLRQFNLFAVFCTCSFHQEYF